MYQLKSFFFSNALQLTVKGINIIIINSLSFLNITTKSSQHKKERYSSMTHNFRVRRGSSRRSSATMAPCSSRVTSPLKEKLLEEVADDEENPIKSYGTGNVQTPRTGRRQSGSQNWSNVRAVMAYYCSLRKIKRFETPAGGFEIMEYAKKLFNLQ